MQPGHAQAAKKYHAKYFYLRVVLAADVCKVNYLCRFVTQLYDPSQEEGLAGIDAQDMPKPTEEEKRNAR